MIRPRIGSMCSGFGGLDLAVHEVLGGELAWVADNDPGASRILAHRFPGVPNHGDITAVDWSTVKPVDVLTAGFPCQPVSAAGRRKGISDERWLWDDIAAAIGRMDPRPGMLLLENVPGLLSANGGDAMAHVIQGLAALGYVGRYRLLRASDAGAPHRRERWLCLAWPADTHSEHLRPYGRAAHDNAPRGWPLLAEPARSRSAVAAHPHSAARGQWRLAEPGEAEGWRPRADAGGRGGAPAANPGRDAWPEDLAYVAPAAGSGGKPAADAPGAGPAKSAPHIPRDGAGHAWPRPGTSDRLAAPDAESDGRHQGRAGTARLVGRPDAAVGGDGPASDSDSAGCTSRLEPQAGWRESGRASAPVDRAGDIRWGAYEPAVRRWERILGRPAPRPTEPGRTGERLSPRFVEWMQGLEFGWVTDVPGLSRNAQLKALGNGVVIQQAAMALRMLLAVVSGECAA